MSTMVGQTFVSFCKDGFGLLVQINEHAAHERCFLN